MRLPLVVFVGFIVMIVSSCGDGQKFVRPTTPLAGKARTDWLAAVSQEAAKLKAANAKILRCIARTRPDTQPKANQCDLFAQAITASILWIPVQVEAEVAVGNASCATLLDQFDGDADRASSAEDGLIGPPTKVQLLAARNSILRASTDLTRAIECMTAH